jgi:hypothetical protein
MTTKSIKFTFVFLLILVTTGCSSRGAQEVGCNFTSGATFIEYNEKTSWGSNLIGDILSGLFNVAIQGAHRTISSDTYDSCAKNDIATCIDSEGKIKKECTLTK